jgi:hypothetical protein
MSRLCLLVCALLVASCGEKAPDEGAIRVSLKYLSFVPACVRVEARDAQGHSGRTDILSSQFKNKDGREVVVAVRRQADWDTALTVTVSSYAESSGSACHGPFVEQFIEGPLTIVPKQFTNFEATLNARDEDHDGSPTGVQWEGRSDCDDTRNDVYPGAPEKCDTKVDFDCDGLRACADPKCVEKTCTDGDLCATNKRCVGVGAAAECGGGQPRCAKAAGQCQPEVTCVAATGQCVEATTVEGQACDPANMCVTNAKCTSEKKCVGTTKSCTTPTQCQEAGGNCNPTSGLCEYTAKPSTTVCNDGDDCNGQDRCNGNGACVGGGVIPCPVRVCQVATGCAPAENCMYSPDPAQLNNPCGEDGSGTPRVCGGNGQCVAFPYTPSNFDPAIPGGELGVLKTKAAVVFNTKDLSWTPIEALDDPDAFDPQEKPQGSGLPAFVLIPLRTLELGGELRIIGDRPVIFAVYGDATLNHDILASGRLVNGSMIPGPGGNQDCVDATGKVGVFASNQGGGGGGAGGGTDGASGGRGQNSDATAGAAGLLLTTPRSLLAGGCAGGNGAGTASAPGGLGGMGGGAVQISVARMLTVTKTLSVSGGAGLGGKAISSGPAGGGGGGGSGGRIILEGFRVNLPGSARLTANGGSGGEGGGNNGLSLGSQDGDSGANGSENTETPAPGGGSGPGGSPSGGNGGNGGTGLNPTQGNAGGSGGFGLSGGGGGGGGAAGSIYLRSIQTCTIAAGSVVSPPAPGGCTAL